MPCEHEEFAEAVGRQARATLRLWMQHNEDLQQADTPAEMGEVLLSLIRGSQSLLAKREGDAPDPHKVPSEFLQWAEDTAAAYVAHGSLCAAFGMVTAMIAQTLPVKDLIAAIKVH
jgi:hypothetical protein